MTNHSSMIAGNAAIYVPRNGIAPNNAANAEINKILVTNNNQVIQICLHIMFLLLTMYIIWHKPHICDYMCYVLHVGHAARSSK